MRRGLSLARPLAAGPAPGRLADWDGLAGWYLDYVTARPAWAAQPPWKGFTAALTVALPPAYSA